MLLLVSPAAAGIPAEEKAFAIEFELYKNNTVSNAGVSVEIADTYIQPQGYGNYTLVLLEGEKPLFRVQTQIDFMETVFLEGIKEANKTEFFARLPYAPQITALQIQHNNNTLETINIPPHVCTADSYCPTYCRNKKVDPDCSSNLFSLPVTAIAILLGIIFLTFVYHKYRKKQREEAHKEPSFWKTLSSNTDE